MSLESSCFLHFVAKEEILQPSLACTLESTTHGCFFPPKECCIVAPAFPKHNPGSLAQMAAPQANSWELATTTSDLASPCESHYARITSHLWALIPISGGRQSLQQGIEEQQHRNSLRISITRAAWPLLKCDQGGSLERQTTSSVLQVISILSFQLNPGIQLLSTGRKL